MAEAVGAKTSGGRKKRRKAWRQEGILSWKGGEKQREGLMIVRLSQRFKEGNPNPKKKQRDIK